MCEASSRECHPGEGSAITAFALTLATIDTNTAVTITSQVITTDIAPDITGIAAISAITMHISANTAGTASTSEITVNIAISSAIMAVAPHIGTVAAFHDACESSTPSASEASWDSLAWVRGEMHARMD
jgi:hypothetical protein